jgi:amidohydrolase
VVAFRHECHRHPELSWQEYQTAERIARELKNLGLEPKTGVGRLGVTALIDGEHPGPTIALRADMDALPVQEITDQAYKSQVKGVMHACGHDGHMANLLGAAMVLKEMRSKLHGRVKLIFQPAEEGGAGAEVMCEDGVLADPKVDMIVGLHGWPELACGHVYLRTGAMLAATTEFKITVEGVGCHAAMPHLGTDQILIASRLVDSLQSLRSRLIAPTEPMALSITQFHGGAATNVIPRQVELGGTLRTVDEATRDRVVQGMKQHIKGFQETYGVTITLDVQDNYPPTVNHRGPTQFVEQVARYILPPEEVHLMPYPSMGGEDFAFYLKRVPGCYFFLGMNEGLPGSHPSLHHPAYDFNDRALPVGIQIFVHAALGFHQSRASATMA